jgi:glutamine synthetase
MNAHADTTGHDVRSLVRRLGKLPQEWQREDLIRLCREDQIRILNLHYTALDGKLKELRLPINDLHFLERVLAGGERVDGSSLFPRLFDAGESDLYVVPVYRWAFLDPWAADELHIVCRFANRHGEPQRTTPDNILAAAAEQLRTTASAELLALAELEFYLVLERDHVRFVARSQRNYHQSAPYLHGHGIADEIIRVVSSVTGNVKYCHSEVGYIDQIASDEPELDGRRVEQYELEFDLMPIEDLGTWLTVARWLIRVIADRNHTSVTYLPKLDEGMAGSGMHLHLALQRDGRNVMEESNGALSEEALRLVGGLLDHAAPLTGFGNTVAASFLRLVPGQEAPTKLCWGRRNRSSLIRVPLSFATRERMDQVMNPHETAPYPTDLARPTIEYRGPDGSAYVHLLLAAVTICACAGLGDPEAAARARALEVQGNIFRQPEVLETLQQLPPTAAAAARALQTGREFFESNGFPARLIDIVVQQLEREADDGLSAELRVLPAAERLRRSRRLMHKDFHQH